MNEAPEDKHQRRSSRWGAFLLGVVVTVIVGVPVAIWGVKYAADDMSTLVTLLVSALLVIGALVGIVFLLRHQLLARVGGAGAIEEVVQPLAGAVRKAKEKDYDGVVERVEEAGSRVLSWYSWVSLRSWMVRVLIGAGAAFVGLVGSVLLFQQNELVAQQNAKIDRQLDWMAKQDEKTAKQIDWMAKQDQKIARQNVLVEAQNQLIGIQNEALLKQFQAETTSRNLERLFNPASRDTSLAALSYFRTDERLRKALFGTAVDLLQVEAISCRALAILRDLAPVGADGLRVVQVTSNDGESRGRVLRPNCTDVWLSRSVFRAIDFVEPAMERPSFQDSVLQDMSFESQRRDWDLTESDFRGAKLEGVVFDGVGLLKSNFAGATLQDVEFRGAVIRKTTFAGATFKNVRFRGARVRETSFANTSLCGVSMDAATELDAFDFRGSKVCEGTQLRIESPTGFIDFSSRVAFGVTVEACGVASKSCDPTCAGATEFDDCNVTALPDDDENLLCSDAVGDNYGQPMGVTLIARDKTELLECKAWVCNERQKTAGTAPAITQPPCP